MQSGGSKDQARHPGKPRQLQGVVLLEVLLALGLFVFAAAVVSSGLNAAVERTLRLKLQTHALDLAVSVLAEIQMGMRPAQPAGPEVFEAPFEAWTWQIETVPYSFGTGELAGLQQVTVIVRGGAPPTVQRLAELLVSPAGGPASDPWLERTADVRSGEVARR
jgi:hypothetical protein